LHVSVSVEAHESPLEAFRRALQACRRAVVAGSIFLVGPVRDELMRLGARPVRYPSEAAPFYLPE
jgi:hypothetical protein